MKILRIVFCILSVLCVAVSIVLGVTLSVMWFLIAMCVAVIFAALMFLCKKRSEPTPPPPAAEYFEDPSKVAPLDPKDDETQDKQ